MPTATSTITGFTYIKVCYNEYTCTIKHVAGNRFSFTAEHRDLYGGQYVVEHECTTHDQLLQKASATTLEAMEAWG